ncbi:putative cyclophilin-type peptidyl-prolyl cis-trans isomerase domain-containing protein [Senna tora]|uniref:Putative cyclophilin-type peptidyl-prolyl cis-trans isomerase domain-containing protein n=1 Tax=Senna tora TaxID=362788 RepID=A0A834SWI1_9FABA|nr:putative cyclophilin-type peptidyl-prolyl cis-trans isomerase domain-containing protein [Senna tora]
MGRKQPDLTLYTRLILLLVCLLSCALVYAFVSAIIAINTNPSSVSEFQSSGLVGEEEAANTRADQNYGCCRGIHNLELWGNAVKWGSEFKFNNSQDCCNACKSMCTGKDGPCLCDSWVFCGNPETCGSKFGECWLKKQKDILSPEKQEGRDFVGWTSGLIFGKGEGIIGLETEYGTLHVKLFPDCAPHSVAYILELLALRHCAGCQFYRAESRGESWDSQGNHVKNAAFGPPYGLIQGTLEAQGTTFKNIPVEDCPTIRRGSVAWIGSGPSFFISLVNHEEWGNAYTVFGSVFPEDMHIVETIAALPTTPDVWNNVNVTVLDKPVPLFLRRIEKSHGEF